MGRAWSSGRRTRRGRPPPFSGAGAGGGSDRLPMTQLGASLAGNDSTEVSSTSSSSDGGGVDFESGMANSSGELLE